MTTQQYKLALDAAVREYEDLGEKRRDIDNRLAQLAQTIGTLNRLCGNVPTVTLSYPSNIPGLPGHNWADGMAMATPIAHKGVTAGAKVQAMTLVDLLLKPEVITAAWDYFKNVQTKDLKYQAIIRPEDRPAIELNTDIMARYRPEMRKYYYDSSKNQSYLEQLGVQYPTVRQPDGSCGGGAVP